MFGDSLVGDIGGVFGVGVDCPPTCNRLRNVTNSVLRLRSRCCKWTASFDEDASEMD